MEELIKSGNGVVLAGDQRRAATYIRYAQRKLVELKRWANLSKAKMGKRYYSFEGGCVDIIIQTVYDMDRIFIKACAGGVCSTKLTLTANTSPSLLVNGFFHHQNPPVGSPGHESKPAEDSVIQAYYLIDWGDNEKTLTLGPISSPRPVNHTYRAAGTYTVSVRSWIKRNLPNELSSDDIVTRTAYYRHATEISGTREFQYNSMIAQPWALVTSSTPDIVFSTGNITRATFHLADIYASERTVFELDMSLIADDDGNVPPIISIVDTFQGLAATRPDHQLGVYVNGTDLVGELTHQDTTLVANLRLLEIEGLSAAATSVELKDTGDWSFPGDSPPDRHFVTNGDSHHLTLYSYKCLAQASKTVTVPSESE